MHIGQLAQRAGVTVKAIRYYERIGLIDPDRQENGYRSFNEQHLRVVSEIRELSAAGIAPNRAGPFVECLDAGHKHGDECVSSLVVYRDTISELDRMIAALAERRAALQSRLDLSANRSTHQKSTHQKSTHQKENTVTDFSQLPKGLPVPQDDGAAAHLAGMRMPALALTTSDGRTVTLSELGEGRSILYLYPLTGRPGVDLPDGWDSIPGARGCSTEACDFRDHFEDLREAGVQHVFGMSSQDPEYQSEVVERLRLPFEMLSDPSFALADALRLPTFAAPGHERLYSRLTLVVLDGVIEHAFYPIFPPNTHAQQVLTWLSER
ncbi:redoxin family protein [Leucobacter viscericola]|uniref:Redoxin family protein n=1 Tax=Leucobacter viscericola TaxID=2714935 RepID=A0A6G7XBF4_9MICO|nr:MerR family DNA-binding transcriptional regulator [Leucobacter viscericola]QIK61832.1 redoxin family protein [Leucobacter viscericola]